MRFKGNGYVDLNKKMIAHTNNANWTLQMNFSTWAEEGLLLWQGIPTNYIALGIRDSKIGFLSDNKEIFARKRVDDGYLHTLAITKEGLNITLTVDDSNEINSLTFDNMDDKDQMKALQKADFYLGGSPVETVAAMTAGKFRNG